jgi:hypothetical protein
MMFPVVARRTEIRVVANSHPDNGLVPYVVGEKETQYCKSLIIDRYEQAGETEIGFATPALERPGGRLEEDYE